MALCHQHGIVVNALGYLYLHTQFLFPVYMLKHTCSFPLQLHTLSMASVCFVHLGTQAHKQIGLWAEDR